MINNLTLSEALSMLDDIPVNNPGVLNNLAKRGFFSNMTGSEKIGWISMALFTSAAVVLEGLYFSQTSCYALALIPGVGEITGAVCVTAAIASMILTAGGITAATNGVISLSGKFGSVTVGKRDGGLETDFQDYNHYANLSHWHGYFRDQGLDTNLVNVGSPLFYSYEGHLYGANATSSVQMLSGHYVHVQHGVLASRMFVGVNQRSDNITKRDSIDPYGNGYDDEGFSNDDGYKGQWCHQHGSAESLDPVNDWSTVNQFVHDLAGAGQTGNTDLWEFQVADSNHNDEQIANIVIEGETEGFGYNEEWSESSICAGQLSG